MGRMGLELSPPISKERRGTNMPTPTPSNKVMSSELPSTARNNHFPPRKCGRIRLKHRARSTSRRKFENMRSH